MMHVDVRTATTLKLLVVARRSGEAHRLPMTTEQWHFFPAHDDPSLAAPAPPVLIPKHRRSPSRLAWLGVAVLPLLVLVTLIGDVIPDPVWHGPAFHFYIVSFTSVLAVFLAVTMGVAARSLADARVTFLVLAFLGLSGIFTVHALTTPGFVVAAATPWTGFSARLSVTTCALFLALSSVSWPRRMQRVLLRHQAGLTGAFALLIVAYGAIAMSAAFQADPTERSTRLVARLTQAGASWALAAVTLAMLGFVVIRYGAIYRLSRMPLAAGFVASAIFLAQAELSMAIAPVWHASWWEYHVLLVAGFTAAAGGLIREYVGTGSLHGVVEGLLLHDAVAQLQRGYTEVIVALVEAVEAKDPYTRGHTQRVAELSTLIGEELRLTPERLRILSQSAMLHDIGKIGIPDAVLKKPGPLTEAEFAIVKEHPARGHWMLRNVRSLQLEVGAVRWHHERLDGSGYPDGLRGDEIPFEARIIAVADVFDALTSARPYRRASLPAEALAIIDAEAGTKLDPQCAAALHAVLARGAYQPAVEPRSAGR